MFIAE